MSCTRDLRLHDGDNVTVALADLEAGEDALRDNDPSPGNTEGGISTIAEKSLGAVL